MTPQEMNYLRHAMEALDDPEITFMAKHKILKTMAQVCERAADGIEAQLQGLVDAKLERNYQDIQNQKVVKILRDDI